MNLSPFKNIYGHLSELLESPSSSSKNNVILALLWQVYIKYQLKIWVETPIMRNEKELHCPIQGILYLFISFFCLISNS